MPAAKLTGSASAECASVLSLDGKPPVLLGPTDREILGDVVLYPWLDALAEVGSSERPRRE
jgi:hypothetical protein